MKKYLLVLLSFIIFAPFVSAAELNLLPEKTSVGLGEKFIVDVLIDGVETQNCINTVEMDISFPKELFAFTDFFEGESVASLWVKKPSASDASKINESGVISLVGGMPGGYCGKIAGDQGPSNLLGRLIFTASSLVEVSQEGSLIIKDGARIFLNDGLGTAEAVPSKTMKVTLDRLSMSGDAEKNILASDKIQPEPFSVELHQSDSMYNGLFYIIFGTNDKQSGIAHYEALELRPDEEVGAKPKVGLFDILFRQKRKVPQWKRLVNEDTQLNSVVYVLDDQSLQSIIEIKAVDKAGNERVVDFTPPKAYQEDVKEKTDQYLKKALSVLGVALAVIIVLLVVVRVIVKRRAKISNF